ncbi:hypothetical protein OQA88_4579 [Cercophora sp. LCS_1]
MSWGSPDPMTRRVGMSCYSTEAEPISHYAITRAPRLDVGSPGAFALAKSWISECASNHATCNKTKRESPPELPTRVLEILEEDDNGGGAKALPSVRLLETNGSRGEYAALSYIWGCPQYCCTTSLNYEEYKREIRASSLPQSIADGVRCAQQLGLRYLWVDSFCIIQDSPADKKRELSRMASNYRRAQITISAAKPVRCNEGFLQTRQVPGLVNGLFRVRVLCPKDHGRMSKLREEYRPNIYFPGRSKRGSVSQEFEGSVWEIGDEAWHAEPSVVHLVAADWNEPVCNDPLQAIHPDREPIGDRAWALQELLASPRLLHYGSRQMVWRCYDKTAADGGRQPEHDRGVHYDYNEYYRDDHSDDETAAELGAMWQKIVTAYSVRTLTFPSDKLDALAGVVDELNRSMTGQQYLAGLWRDCLIDNLSWYQDMGAEGHEAISLNPNRSCPSWTWIGVDGRVDFCPGEEVIAEIKSAVVTRVETIQVRHHCPCLVVEGNIVIQLPVLQLEFHEVAAKFRCSGPGMSMETIPNIIYLDGGMRSPALSRQIVGGRPTLVLSPGIRFAELTRGGCWRNVHTPNASRGLVLVPVPVAGREHVYRRVGFFAVDLECGLPEGRWPNTPGDLRMPHQKAMDPSEFGELWTEALEEEVITII